MYLNAVRADANVNTHRDIALTKEGNRVSAFVWKFMWHERDE